MPSGLGNQMRHWSRNVFLGNHDLQERLRTEIVRRWPEAHYPFHIQVAAEETISAIEVRVWSENGIYIFEEATPETLYSSGEDHTTVAAVLHTVELALREAATESFAINRGVPS